MFGRLITLALIVLTACSTTRVPSSHAPVNTAMVTSVSNGRMSVPNERMYGLRVPSGRVYFVTQSLEKPLKEGDMVEIEVVQGGRAHIRER